MLCANTAYYRVTTSYYYIIGLGKLMILSINSDGKHICTMMKLYFKGKTASTNPCTLEISYTVYENTPQLHSKVAIVIEAGKDSTMSGLWHHSTSQLYYGFLRCVWVLPFVWYNTHTP